MTCDEKGAYRVDGTLLPFLRLCFGLNHEINNSLAGIVGYCEFLLDERENLTADQRTSVEQIRSCALKIQQTVEILAAEKSVLAEKMDIESLSQDAAQP